MNLRNLFRRTTFVEAGGVAVAEPEEEALVALPIDLRLGDVDHETEYNRVANKLQVRRRPNADWRKLAGALEELMIPVYDFGKVAAFLTEKAEKAAQEEAKASPGGTAQWNWQPLRQCDVDTAYLRAISEPGSLGAGWAMRHVRMGGRVDWQHYGKEVPLPALLTAERIEDKLPGEVAFYVSDVQRYPDPFLAVMLKSDPDHKLFVVERWDEPSFRG